MRYATHMPMMHKRHISVQVIFVMVLSNFHSLGSFVSRTSEESWTKRVII
uniref:Uncharacterized protein n=1 Tax=Arundo donax TaxID=35708 RepID=A0A0A9EBN5_ARUDO